MYIEPSLVQNTVDVEIISSWDSAQPMYSNLYIHFKRISQRLTLREDSPRKTKHQNTPGTHRHPPSRQDTPTDLPHPSNIRLTLEAQHRPRSLLLPRELESPVLA